MVYGIWYARERIVVAYMLQRKRLSGQPSMTALLLASVPLAGAVNVALVTFVADRLTPKSSVSVISAGELAVVNDNASVVAGAKRAA